MRMRIGQMGVSQAIQLAKMAVNHAQVVLASERGVAVGANLDDMTENDGSPEAGALGMAYADLCLAEMGYAEDPSGTTKRERALRGSSGVIRQTFTTAFADYRDREGQKFEVLQKITEPNENFDEESLPMYRIRFEDGVETDAFPCEVEQ